MPYVKLGLTVLKVAAAAGKLTGFPIPDLKSMIDSQLIALGDLKEEAITKMCAFSKVDEATVRELLGAVDTKCQELELINGKPLEKKLMNGLQDMTEMSASELDKLLKEDYPDWKGQCGLVGAFHEDSGTYEWVLPKNKEAFEAKGKEAFEA